MLYPNHTKKNNIVHIAMETTMAGMVKMESKTEAESDPHHTIPVETIASGHPLHNELGKGESTHHHHDKKKSHPHSAKGPF
ncbi:hypothetical protein A2U01_0082097, partial [Trifolium medium]|nr:hypothetical protein [Trifolium medium]